VGKPRSKWEDVTRECTAQVIGIRGWRRQAGDREKRRLLQRENRARKGL